MWNHIKDDVDGSIERLDNWYGSDKYRDREYKKGREPREQLFWILLGVSEKYGNKCTPEEIEKYGNMFTGEIYTLGSYVLQIMHGQGSVVRIDKK